MDSTITVTFGDVAENHVRNKKIGKLADDGLSKEDLERIAEYWRSQGFEPELLRIGTMDAHVLLIRKVIEDELLYEELYGLDWDKKALMYGQVRNKRARHNLCFGDESIEPNYSEGQGRVYGWNELPQLRRLRDRLVESGFLSIDEIVAEGNHYFEDSCFIGWHGDRERRNTVAVRLGKPMWMQWQWYQQRTAIPDEKLTLLLGHGDVYYMCKKAVGQDFLCKKIPTVRHCAGYELRDP